MDESVTKGMKLVSLDDAALALPDSCEISRVVVTGFDSKIPPVTLEMALRKHFGSCGVITDVFIPFSEAYRRYALIYLLGEGAKGKALQLDRSVFEGQNISVTAEPIAKETYPSLRVDGYDPSLTENDLKDALTTLFSSFYRIFQVTHFKGSALLFVGGNHAAEKASELKDGYIRGRKVSIRHLSGPHAYVRDSYGPFGCDPDDQDEEVDSLYS